MFKISNEETATPSRMKALTRIAVIAISSAIICLVLSGCDSNDSIVGSWREADGSNDRIMTFWESGSCENVTYKNTTHDMATGYYESYELQSDGTIMIIGSYWGDRAATIKPTDSKEAAVDDRTLYYLNGSTLIWDKTEYIRV